MILSSSSERSSSAGLAVALVARAVAMPRMRTEQAIGHIDGYGYAGAVGEAESGSGVEGALDHVANTVGGVRRAALRGLARGGAPERAHGRGPVRDVPAHVPRLPRPLRHLRAGCVALACTHHAARAPTHCRRPHHGGPRGLDDSHDDRAKPVAPPARANRLRASRADRPARGHRGGGPRLQRFAADRGRAPGGRARRRDAADAAGAEHGPVDRRGAAEHARARRDPAMRSFVRSIVQGETLGVSIGEILRNLAIEMRKRRREWPRSGPRRRRSRSSSRWSS